MLKCWQKSSRVQPVYFPSRLILKKFYSSSITIVGCVIGVPILVYSYKCVMLALFQSKLIYLPYLPLGSRDPENLKITKNIKFGIKPIKINYASTIGRARWPWPLNLGAKSIVLKGYIVDKKNNDFLRPAEHPGLSRHYGIGSSRFGDYKPTELKSTKSEEFTVIYFQGNGGNMIHRLDLFETFLNATHAMKAKFRIVAVHLRGYGDSSGSPSQPGLMEDGLALIRYVKKTYPSSKIILYGHSLGGAVALHLLSKLPSNDQIAGVIVENTFTSIQAMVASMYPAWLPYRQLARHFLRSPWDNLLTIKTISTLPPTLCLSSLGDDIVPPTMMKEIYQTIMKSSSPTLPQLVTFPYAHHTNLYLQPNFDTTLREWLNNQSR